MDKLINKSMAELMDGWVEETLEGMHKSYPEEHSKQGEHQKQSHNQTV